MIVLIILLLLTGCCKTEIINAPIRMPTDTTVTKTHKDFPTDSVEVGDTARVPIGWSPSVDDWDETNVEK